MDSFIFPVLSWAPGGSGGPDGAAPGFNNLHCNSAYAAIPNPKSLNQSREFINGGKSKHKKYSTFRGRASLENLSACALSTSLFCSVMTFPRAAAQRGEGRAGGSRERRTTQRDFASAERTWLPRICAALSNDTADQCRSDAHIMALA